MHKSKLGGFIIDCRTDDLAQATDFWSKALGLPVRELPGAEGDSYRKLHDAHSGLDIEVQKVDHPSRVHLDIESDDISRPRYAAWKDWERSAVQQIQTWWVMEAPTGQRFCVVRVSSPKFEEQASKWP